MNLAKLIILNLIIFIGLIFGSILFEFLFLGWGASASSPSFNADLALISQIIIVGFLSIRKKTKKRKIELLIIFFLLLGLYFVLKFGLSSI